MEGSWRRISGKLVYIYIYNLFLVIELMVKINIGVNVETCVYAYMDLLFIKIMYVTNYCVL